MGVVYRPNSAKVKNLKTKDYLGKARLVATSDQSNAFTGFAGSEAKKNAAGGTGKDDRPLDTISFAASNLVKTDLPRRNRQQSAPPINRNMFPPTPPPDAEPVRPQLATTNTSPAANIAPMSSRANSVRSGPRPERLNLLRQDSNLSRQDPAPPERQDPSSTHDPPRRGTTRTASEPRGPSRQYSSATRQREPRDYPTSKGRLFMETTPLRETGEDADIDEYPDELYEMYGSPTNNQRYGGGSQRRHSSRRRERSRSRRRPQYISEEEDDDFGPSNTSSLSDFEILNNAGGRLSRPPPPRNRERSRSRTGVGRGQSRRAPELKNIRVKVHSGDDTRYVMVGSAVVFEDFVDRVKEKFGIKTRYKLKIKDEGDFITLGDADDWDMALSNVRKEAQREGGELGKLEVCAFSLSWFLDELADVVIGLDPGTCLNHVFDVSTNSGFELGVWCVREWVLCILGNLVSSLSVHIFDSLLGGCQRLFLGSINGASVFAFLAYSIAWTSHHAILSEIDCA